VDYCVQSSGKDGSGAISPDLEHIIEAGLSLDRKFANGLSIEATATYAQGNEKSGIAAFDDLQALGLGLELGYDKFKLGGSWLDSNNGLADGDYSAWDVGATWRPSQWGFTAGYGQSKDKNIGLTSDQALFGLSYDWNENYRLGAGVQYIDRDVPFNVGGIITPTEEKATSVFIEGRVTF
jgi:predicted porin